MLSRYHIEITKESIGSFFPPASLREIARANVGQDSLPSLFGVEARRHVCDCTVTESLAYIDEEHAQIAELAQQPGQEARQRAALGRLLHTVQDFYAHTNYIALWLAERGGSDRVDTVVDTVVDTLASTVTFQGVSDGLDPDILAHPALKIAQWTSWRDPFYYVPVVGRLMRRFWLPEGSHEAIHLDSPNRGAIFYLAVAIARQRTRSETARAVAAIRGVGGRAAVARFHGIAAYPSRAHAAEASR